MKILVINAGSSSIKYQLIDMDTNALLAKGQADRIGIEGGNFKQKVEGREDYKLDVHMANHAEAVSIVLETLTSKENGVISSLSEISAVGHGEVARERHFRQRKLLVFIHRHRKFATKHPVGRILHGDLPFLLQGSINRYCHTAIKIIP